MAASTQGNLFAGADLGLARIRAGVFSPGGKLLGKAKFTAKPDRGPLVVADRLARCIRDAVDECDLGLADIRGIGLAVPGKVNAAGVVSAVAALGWKDFPVREELEQRLQVPVVVESDCHLGALAIFEREFQGRAKAVVALFLERPWALGQVVQGLDRGSVYVPRALPDLSLRGDPRKPPRGNPAKLLRKALLAKKPGADAAVEQVALKAGSCAAEAICQLKPDYLVLGGGAIEELHSWVFPAVLNELQDRVPPEVMIGVEVEVSKLGNDAVMLGAALLAARLQVGG